MQFLLRLLLVSFFLPIFSAHAQFPSPSPAPSGSPPPLDPPKILSLTPADGGQQRTRIRSLALASSIALDRGKLRTRLGRYPGAFQVRHLGKSLETPQEIAWTSEQFEVTEGDGDTVAAQIVWTPPEPLRDGLLEVQVDTAILLGYGGKKQRLYLHQLHGDFDGSGQIESSERNRQAQYCAAYDEAFQRSPAELRALLDSWEIEDQGKLLAEVYRIGISATGLLNARMSSDTYSARRQSFLSLLSLLSSEQVEAFHRHRKSPPEAYALRLARYQQFLSVGLGIATSTCPLQYDRNDDLEFSNPDIGTLSDSVVFQPQLQIDHVFTHVPPLGTSLTQADCSKSPRSPYVALFDPRWNDVHASGWTMQWTAPRLAGEASRSQLYALADGRLCYIPSPFMPASARESAQYRLQSKRGDSPQVGEIRFHLVYPGKYKEQQQEYTSDLYRREGIQPQEVAVVFNQLDPQGWSPQLAAHYAERHAIPAENIFGIQLPSLQHKSDLAFAGYFVPDPNALFGLRNEVQAVRESQRHTLVDVRDLEREIGALLPQLPDSIQMLVLAWTYPNSVIYPVRVQESGEVLQVSGKEVLFNPCHAITSAVAFSDYQNSVCQQNVLQSTLGRGDALAILRGNSLKFQMAAALNPYYASSSSHPWSDHGMRPTLQLAGFSYSDLTGMIDRGVASRLGIEQAEARLVITSDSTRSGIRAAAMRETGTLLKELSALKIVTQDLCATNPAQCGPAGASDSIADKDLSAPIVLYQQHTSYPQDTNLALASGARNKYAPGAIADHATSFGGVWWFPDGCGARDVTPACTGRNALGQLSSLSWIAGGATGSYGSVWEPIALTSRFPDPLIVSARYYLGDTLGEAYWKSVREPVGVFHGDPLAKPFGSKFFKTNGVQYLRATNFLSHKPVYVLACQNSAPDSCTILAGPLVGQGPLQGDITMELPTIRGAVYRLTEQPIVPE